MKFEKLKSAFRDGNDRGPTDDERQRLLRAVSPPKATVPWINNIKFDVNREATTTAESLEHEHVQYQSLEQAKRLGRYRVHVSPDEARLEGELTYPQQHVLNHFGNRMGFRSNHSSLRARRCRSSFVLAAVSRWWVEDRSGGLRTLGCGQVVIVTSPGADMQSLVRGDDNAAAPPRYPFGLEGLCNTRTAVKAHGSVARRRRVDDHRS